MQQPPNPYPQYPQQPNGYGQPPTNYGQPPHTPYPPQQGQWQQPITPNPQWSQQQAFGYPPPQKPKKKNSKKFVALVLGIVVATVLFGCIGMSVLASMKSQTAQQTTTNQSSVTQAVQQKSTQATQQPTSKPTPKPTQAVRQVTGKATTLGAGTFSGGKDVPVGLYDVTAPGQSGNFIVTGTDTYNEIFGQGVTKIRAQISDGDKIELSDLSNVTFTPVSTPFVTTHTLVTLYAGTFIVGQDIGAGRYVATTTPGSSGNFIVSGADSVNEILGQNDAGGVPSVTTDLTDGDVITISGLGQVTMTPQ